MRIRADSGCLTRAITKADLGVTVLKASNVNVVLRSHCQSSSRGCASLNGPSAIMLQFSFSLRAVAQAEPGEMRKTPFSPTVAGKGTVENSPNVVGRWPQKQRFAHAAVALCNATAHSPRDRLTDPSDSPRCCRTASTGSQASSPHFWTYASFKSVEAMAQRRRSLAYFPCRLIGDTQFLWGGGHNSCHDQQAKATCVRCPSIAMIETAG